jgi:hypothetical protein
MSPLRWWSPNRDCSNKTMWLNNMQVVGQNMLTLCTTALVLCLLLLIQNRFGSPNHRPNNHEPIFRSGPRRLLRRNLQDFTPYPVKLFLSLKYLDDTAALQIESDVGTILSTNAANHLCEAVNMQVSSFFPAAFSCFQWFTKIQQRVLGEWKSSPTGFCEYLCRVRHRGDL